METNKTKEMHDEITSTEEETDLSDVVVEAEKHVEAKQKATSMVTLNISPSNNNIEDSMERETTNNTLPIEPVFHVINIDDTDDLEESKDNKNDGDHMEIISEHCQVNGETNLTETEPLTNTRKARPKYTARPKRSVSVRDHFRRNKEEFTINTGPYLSASAPHLTGMIESSVATTINSVLRHMLQPMENRMNIKVFGSKRAMKDEQVRYSKVGFVIHPTSSFR